MRVSQRLHVELYTVLKGGFVRALRSFVWFPKGVFMRVVWGFHGLQRGVAMFVG